MTNQARFAALLKESTALAKASVTQPVKPVEPAVPAVIVEDAESLLMTSHSIDGTFENCARRFEFLHAYMRAPEKESDAYAADVGTALHEAVQEWQRRLFYGESHAEAEGKGAITLLRWWPWEVEDSRKDQGKAIGERTLGNALLLLAMIYESPVWTDWELVSIENFGPAIEVPWRIVHKSMGKIPLPYGREGFIATQGKIDFIFRHKVTRKFKVFDLKTTEKKKVAHDAAFRFSGQAGQYGIVLDHALGIDSMKDGLDITYLMAMFGSAYGGEDNLGNPMEVYPLNYHLDSEELADAVAVKIERLDRMKAYAMRGYWPRRTHGCEFFGTPCGFLDICHRRDQRFIEQWMEFEVASGRFRENKRVYEPVWIMEA